MPEVAASGHIAGASVGRGAAVSDTNVVAKDRVVSEKGTQMER